MSDCVRRTHPIRSLLSVLQSVKNQICGSVRRRSPPLARRASHQAERPGVERSDLLDAVFKADLAAFAAQAPQLAQRYRTVTEK
jgi:hypothetical protein